MNACRPRGQRRVPRSGARHGAGWGSAGTSPGAATRSRRGGMPSGARGSRRGVGPGACGARLDVPRLGGAVISGPYSGGQHEFMQRDRLVLTIPNPHRGDIRYEGPRQPGRQDEAMPLRADRRRIERDPELTGGCSSTTARLTPTCRPAIPWPGPGRPGAPPPRPARAAPCCSWERRGDPVARLTARARPRPGAPPPWARRRRSRGRSAPARPARGRWSGWSRSSSRSTSLR